MKLFEISEFKNNQVALSKRIINRSTQKLLLFGSSAMFLIVCVLVY